MFDFIKNNIFLWIFIFLMVVAPTYLAGAMQIFGIILLAIFALLIIGGYILKRKLTKMASQFNTQFNNQENPFTKEESGRDDDPEMKVYKTDATPATEKKISDKVGDYVDFEEIKE